MKTLFSTCVLFLLSFHFAFSQCSENEETKVLLVGDSWAFFMNVDGTINNVYSDWGHSNVKYFTNLTLSENGAETVDFLTPTKQGEIANQLISKPTIEYVHLSIGGNDVLGSWKSQSFTQAQTDSLRFQVKDSVIAVIDFIKGVRPDVKVVWGGYAYPNFEEVITGTLLPSIHPFYGTWQGMENPSNQEINDLLNIFSSDIESYYANDPRVEFVKATGITQYSYGQIDPLGIAPYGTYAPLSAPLPYGFTDYPSPKNSMRNYGVFKDCFHLSVQGYRDLIGYTTQKFYHKAFMADKYFIAEDSLTTGSVSSDGTVSTKLLLGDLGGTVHKTILTFETLYNLDSIAEKASLFLHRIQHTGNEPIDPNVLIEINDGAFGISAAVEAVDFSAPSKEEGNPCVFGSNTDGNWVRLDLPSELLEYITVNDITQFKISSPFISEGIIEFSGTSDPDFAPVLNVTYGNEALVALPEEKINQNVVIYPNPSSDLIHVKVNTAEIHTINIYAIDGKAMLSTENTAIDISKFPQGTYFIHVNTNKGIATQKLIKN